MKDANRDLSTKRPSRYYHLQSVTRTTKLHSRPLHVVRLKEKKLFPRIYVVTKNSGHVLERLRTEALAEISRFLPESIVRLVLP